MKAETKAAITAESRCSRSEVATPVATIDSPSAMITNSWKRSVKCSLTMSQASALIRFIRGTQNRASGPE